MKYLYIATAAVLWSFVAQAQQYGLHFMRNNWTSTLTNPGFSPRQRFVIALPSPALSFNAGGLNTSLFKETSSNVYNLNAEEVIDNLDGDVNFRFNTNTDILGVGMRFNRFFVSLNTATRMSGNVVLPEDLIKLAYYGNVPYIGETLDLGWSLDMDAYQEVGVGLNYAFSRNFSVGIRAKRLTGLFTTWMDKNVFQWTAGEDHYETSVFADYRVYYYGSDILGTIKNGKGVNEFTDAFEAAKNQEFFDELADAPFNAIRNLPRDNKGWAFDLGAEINLKNKVTLAASILDIGSINWENDMKRLTINEDFTFSGLDFGGIITEEGDLDVSESLDSLQELLVFKGTDANAFTRQLPTKVYLSATARLFGFDAGGLLFTQLDEQDAFSSIAVSLRRQFGNIASVGAIYAFNPDAFDNLGINGQVNLGPAQVFVVLDNIMPLINPEKLERTNVRAGVNIAFGTKRMEKYLRGEIENSDVEAKNAKKEKKVKEKRKKSSEQ